MTKYENVLSTEYSKIMRLFNVYESNTGERLQVIDRQRTYQTLNGKSCLILEVIQVLKNSDEVNVRKIIQFFLSHIKDIRENCLNIETLFTFDREMHDLDPTTEFKHEKLEDKLKAVEVRGDGNCLWNSISVALFGDYSMMESLRLLTASTLLDNENQFSDYLREQRKKYGYNHELGFEGLVSASTELQVWGDEIHILALSLALERPVYSFGSLDSMRNKNYSNYEELREDYEKTYLQNHFKYIANTDHERNRPILLYYNGENHYCVVLPTDPSVEPLVPYSQVLDPLINNRKGN